MEFLFFHVFGIIRMCLDYPKGRRRKPTECLGHFDVKASQDRWPIRNAYGCGLENGVHFAGPGGYELTVRSGNFDEDE